MPRDNYSSEAPEKSRILSQQLDKTIVESNISDSSEISDSDAKAIVGGRSGGPTGHGSVIW